MMVNRVCVATLFALLSPVLAQASVITTVDTFESGSLGPQWSVSGLAADVAVRGEISAYVDYFQGPYPYPAPQGQYLMDVAGGVARTTALVSLLAPAGSVLSFDWLFATVDAPFYDGVEGSAGVSVNGVDHLLATSSTTGYGLGGDNTCGYPGCAWDLATLSLPTGPVTLGFWADNGIGAFNKVNFAVDNIRVTSPDVSAVPIPATGWLFLSCLGLLGGLARRKANVDRDNAA